MSASPIAVSSDGLKPPSLETAMGGFRRSTSFRYSHRVWQGPWTILLEMARPIPESGNVFSWPGWKWLGNSRDWSILVREGKENKSNSLISGERNGKRPTSKLSSKVWTIRVSRVAVTFYQTTPLLEIASEVSPVLPFWKNVRLPTRPESKFGNRESRNMWLYSEKSGGSSHQSLNINRKAIAKKYREGNVKRNCGIAAEREHEMTWREMYGGISK